MDLSDKIVDYTRAKKLFRTIFRSVEGNVKTKLLINWYFIPHRQKHKNIWKITRSENFGASKFR